MPSTVIEDVAYHAPQRELRITFTTGRIYIYANVPPHVVEALVRAGSRGAYFNRYIRDRYAYREIDPNP